MTPNPYAYLDHYQEEPEIAPVTIGGYNTLKKTYSYNPVPADADSLVKQHIIGVQLIAGLNICQPRTIVTIKSSHV